MRAPAPPFSVQAVEDRRTTKDLREAEFQYLLGAVKIPGCPDVDQHHLCVVDAILYYDRPDYAVPSRAEGGLGLSYYLTVKARNLFIDAVRSSRTLKRGQGLIVSLDLNWHGDDAPKSDAVPHWANVANPDSVDPAVLAFEEGTAHIRAVVLACLHKFPVKQKLFTLHLDGANLWEIMVGMNWANPETPTGMGRTNRARKALYDTQLMVARLLPALNARRFAPGVKWNAGDSDIRPARYLNTATCAQLRAEMEGYPLPKRGRVAA